MILFTETCRDCSKIITKRYSTSFSMGIRAFAAPLRMPIYSIYGFVRFADEIVDTFHDYPKAELLERFRRDTELALAEKVSFNPVLHAFQDVVHRFGIEKELIDAFLDSMEMDLHQSRYGDRKSYDQYIYGSAEVVGLMCLRVFCNGDRALFDRLRASAQSLGAAFQKVNFLRDLKDDFDDRGRVYFPGVDFDRFTEADKTAIEADIRADFHRARAGILQLPPSARFGVYLAYKYYIKLFEKICRTNPCHIKNARIRVPDSKKALLFFTSAVRAQLNML